MPFPFWLVLAVVCVVLGFHHSKRERLREQCRAEGHVWGVDNKGWSVCMRCDQRCG
jgi:hypothetical protein